jgi:hypothetical protein
VIENMPLNLGAGYQLLVFENKVLWKIFGASRDK